jgi:phage terminase small subunit
MARPKLNERTPLTARQRVFVDAYLDDKSPDQFNGVRCAMKAYNTLSYWSAASIACQQLKKPNIKKIIDDDHARRYPQRTQTNAEWLAGMKAVIDKQMGREG